MTVEEAQRIFDQLCLIFRWKGDDKESYAREAQLWLQQLRTVPYHLADQAVWEISRSPKFKFMPKIPEFLSFVDEIHNQGTANALGTIGEVPHVTEFERWRSEQIVAMTDEEYWRYLFDEDYRRQTERRWEQQWQQMGGRVA